METIRKTSKSGIEYRIIDNLPYNANVRNGCYEIEMKKIFHSMGEEIFCWFPAIEPVKLFTDYQDALDKLDELCEC